MKLSLMITGLILTPAEAFAPNPQQQHALSSMSLHMGLFDLKPFHGGGSGDSQAARDEQWETQKAILRARRGHTDKEHLKKKYAKAQEIESKPAPSRTKVVSQKTDDKAHQEQERPKFFWEK